MEVVAVDAGKAVSGAPWSPTETAECWVPGRYAIAALLVALATAVAMLAWWQHRSEVSVSVSERAAVRSGDIDASGCPVDASCESRVPDTTALGTAVARIFPTAEILQTSTLATRGDGKILRTTALLRTDDAVFVNVSAQCEAGAAAVPRRRGPLKTVGPADGLLVVPGVAGCSVAVAAHAPAGVFVPIRELEELAYDPTVQLQP
jgi:hypothetical protein